MSGKQVDHSGRVNLYGVKTESLSLDFRAGNKAEERVEVAGSELELLDQVRFTETFEELDTITVCSDLVKDPERFTKICVAIVGTNFLRIPPEMNNLTSQGMFRTGYPVWL
jgi:hypothetical protein